MLASSNDQAAAIHGKGGSQMLSSGGCQVGTDNVELDSDGSEAGWQSFIKSIGMNVSPGSESSDEEGWCSRIRRASQNMCNRQIIGIKRRKITGMLASGNTLWK